MCPDSDKQELTQEQIEKISAANQEEQAKIVSAIGNVTATWADLEAKMHSIFANLARYPYDSLGREISGAIFYAPTNMETRIGLVDSLMTYQFDFRAKVAEDRIIIEAWWKIKGKIDSLKNVRNSIVHGTLGTWDSGDLTKQRPRLTPAFADTLRLLPQIGQEGRLHPGLGSAEIFTHRDAVWRVIVRLINLAAAVRLQLQRETDHRPAEVEKRRAAIALLNTPTNNQNDQNHTQPKADAPDLSSGE